MGIQELEDRIYGEDEAAIVFQATGYYYSGTPQNKNLVKAIAVGAEFLLFENGWKLASSHDSDCCENHYLSFGDLSIKDFERLEFDLTKDDFFERVPDYGIRLKPINGHPISVPGYGVNNGYYSSNLDLIVTGPNDYWKEYDVEECQVIG
jgi:hypothetical protein